MLTEIQVSIPPPIAALTPRLTPATATRVEEAAAAIARLDQVATTTLTPLGGLLLRSESVASSKIEHVHADRDDLARALAGKDAGEDARATAAAIAALRGLIDHANDQPLTVDAILCAHRRLLRGDRFEGSWAGRWRGMQNWIGGSDFSPRDADYVPPPAAHVPALMEDLAAAANRADLPAVAQAAVVHAQLESIHPFTDGNGRIGRALLSAVLRRRRLTTSTVVPVASVMLGDVATYLEHLDGYRAGDVDAPVGYVARSAVIAAEEAATTAVALGDLPVRWRDTVRPRRRSTADVLIGRLLAHPILDAATAVAVSGTSTKRVYDALDDLTAHGVLTEITGGRRSRVWTAGDVLDELDRLEARIGRRVSPRRGG